ncbi:hypothetical protein E4T42_08451 [Aureobasidium subglaciale]|nr:hypothetical protein E4T42_08451 [Aureobasidium subglaciale]
MADFFDIPTLTFLVSTVTQQNVALDERLKSKSQEHNDFIEKAKVAEASVLKIQEDLELERQVWKDESLKLKEDLRLSKEDLRISHEENERYRQNSRIDSTGSTTKKKPSLIFMTSMNLYRPKKLLSKMATSTVTIPLLFERDQEPKQYFVIEYQDYALDVEGSFVEVLSSSYKRLV